MVCRRIGRGKEKQRKEEECNREKEKKSKCVASDSRDSIDRECRETHLPALALAALSSSACRVW